MRFLIQADPEDRPLHDFGWAATEAIRYQNWIQREEVYTYEMVKEASPVQDRRFVPIGSIAFVESYLGRELKPTIPLEELRAFWQRDVKILEKSELESLLKTKSRLFIKQANKLKGEVDIIKSIENGLPDGPYFASEVLDIQSEWRCFVRNNALLDVRPYIADFERVKNKSFPDINSIVGMIDALRNLGLYAYTLDVAVITHPRGYITIPLEVHNFVSVGLYGFCDYRHLLYMLLGGWVWETMLSPNG